MIEHWFRSLKLRISAQKFDRLPRNPAFKYEYFDNHAWLSPRPKIYHARLPLGPRVVPERVEAWGPVGLRLMRESDWEALPETFAAAFHLVQPFIALNEPTRLKAARSCLRQTRRGDEGPLVAPACWVAESLTDSRIVGAALVTALRPKVDLTAIASPIWLDPPPDWLEQGIGTPHLTWIFVGPTVARHGVGSALLAAVVNELYKLGFRELATTFLLGNDSSLLWHWRNGFELLAYPGSFTKLGKIPSGPPA